MEAVDNINPNHYKAGKIEVIEIMKDQLSKEEFKGFSTNHIFEDKDKNLYEILGIDEIDKVIQIDQTPIGRTPRSNPATYSGVFTKIRELFASTPSAKEKGFDMGKFSFNVEGGRCESASGI